MSNKIDTTDMVRHVQYMEDKFGSMKDVPNNYPELQLLHNQLDTRSDEELLPKIAELRNERKLIPEIQKELRLSWFRIENILNTYEI